MSVYKGQAAQKKELWNMELLTDNLGVTSLAMTVHIGSVTCFHIESL